MINYKHSTLNNQNGSALFITTMVMLVLTAVGILVLNTSSLDINIASNDKFNKMTFYATDGGAQMTTELLEQNIDERGFGTGPVARQQVTVHDGDFYLNEEDLAVCLNNDPSPTNRDIETPRLGDSNVYLKVYGNTRLSTGNALQIAAGDKGRGKGLAGGGAQIVYDIRSLGQGLSQSEARVLVRWIHVI